MNKIVHGAIIGLIIGGLAVLLIWSMYLSIVRHIDDANAQHLVMLAWTAGYTILGAILGAVLPRKK